MVIARTNGVTFLVSEVVGVLPQLTMVCWCGRAGGGEKPGEGSAKGKAMAGVVGLPV